jgi:cell division protein FtsB
MAKAERSRQRPAPSNQRKARLILFGAALLSVVILVAWFPAGALLHQRSDLASANTQLRGLHQQDSQLAQEGKDLSNSAEISRIAREQYQLVSPGQRAYEVLPAAGSSSNGKDPGDAAPANPSAAAQLPSNGTSTSTGSRVTADKSQQNSSSAFDRMLRALEFWR